MMTDHQSLSGQSFRAKLVGVGPNPDGKTCLLLDLVGRERGFSLPLDLLENALVVIRIEDDLQISFPETAADKVFLTILKAGSS